MRIIASIMITIALTTPSGAPFVQQPYTQFVAEHVEKFKEITKRHGLSRFDADYATIRAAAWVWAYTCPDRKSAPKQQVKEVAKLMSVELLIGLGADELYQGGAPQVFGAMREMAFVLMHGPFIAFKNEKNRKKVEANGYSCRFAKETALPYVKASK